MQRAPEALSLHEAVRDRRGAMGTKVPRGEDQTVLAGTATYVADIRLLDMVDVAFVRSTVAHGRITGLDVSAALTVPGVIDAVGAAEVDDVGSFPDYITINKPVGQRVLACDVVRYVGAPVAAVVAENRYLAEDGAELVAASLFIDDLPTVVTLDQALADDATLLFPEWGDNKVVDLPGDRPEVRDRLEQAPRRFSETYVTQRQTPLPMETRGVVADFRDGRLTVWASHQSPHIARTTYAMLLGMRESDIKVVCPRVGGSFGAKTHVYAEELVIARLAIKLRRPVRWIEDRAEHLVSAVHARDQHHIVDVGYDDDGVIHAMSVHVISDVGSGEVFMPGTCTSLVTGGVMTAAYDVPHLEVSTTCIVTNKTPSGAYRGFGAPEGVFVMERVIERVARLVGKAANDVRAPMILQEEQMPYTMPGGGRIDSGSHQQTFDRIIELGITAASRATELHAGNPNIRVGVGYTNYVEPSVPTYFGTTGHWTGHDAADIRIEPDGSATVAVGVTEMGQGMYVTTQMLAADALGMDVDDIAVVMGDTDRSPYGLGSWGSRGAVVMAGSVVKASEIVLDKARQVAAHKLEAVADDIVVTDGAFAVRGSPGGPSVTWAEIATTAVVRTIDLPPELVRGLEGAATYDPYALEHFPDESGRIHAAATWPNAAHAAVVAVDIRTGHIAIEDYFVVHDCGRIIHPSVVEGQITGGVAQGIAGAMFEHLQYDATKGQPQTASFLGYLVPTIAEIPRMTTEHFETLAPDMPLGIKGVGEAGTIGPPAAIANAVCDALAEYDLDITSNPITPMMVRDSVRGREAST